MLRTPTGTTTTGPTLGGLASLGLLGQAALAAVVALVVSVLVHVVVKRAGRRSVVATDVTRRGQRPFRALLVVLFVQQALARSDAVNTWLSTTRTALGLVLIAVVAWLVGAMAFVAEDAILGRYRVDVVDNRHARRVRTQVSFLRRVVVGVIVVLAVAAMLFTFPSVKQVGATIFASAGLLSVVAGLAAQTSLANVFAGLQLAFTDALRVDDVVVVQEEWGRIEEITLTYVVLHIWDDRRLVLPSTYFTSTPFENWTRRDSQLLGMVLLEVDWTTDFDAMRAELHRVVDVDPLWDRRVAVLQVTDAVDSFVQLRILVSAKDGPTVFDLRCHVREAMVRWLTSADAAGLPRLRISTDDAGLRRAATSAGSTAGADRPRSGASAGPSGEATGRPPRRDHTSPAPGRREPATPATTVLPPLVPAREDSLFTGSREALERSRQFSGPSEAEQAERAQRDAGARRPALDEDTSTQLLPQVPPPSGSGGGERR